MPASINIASVRTNFIADVSRFEQGTRRLLGQTARVRSGLRGLQRDQQAFNRTGDQFVQSIRSSLIATAAYAVGVEGIRRAIGGSIRAFIDYDRGLIAVSKTTGLTVAETDQLGRQLDIMLTRVSALHGPLPIAAADLLQIATIAGQMRVQGVRDIAAFSETVGLLGLTTDLAAGDAANALGKIIALTQATAEESFNLGNAITALGNQVRGGEREILVQAQSIAAAASAYELQAETVLGLSAVFSQAGLQAESAGTVIQRTLATLANATESQVTIIANAARVGADSLQTLIDSGDRRGQLDIFVRALANLPETDAGSEELTRREFIEGVFGESNVRISRVLGVLARDYQEYLRILELANDEYSNGNALLDEANRRLEAYDARLQVVGNQLQSQGRAIGGAITPTLVAIAENFRAIEVAALTAGAAIASRFLFRPATAQDRGGLITRAGIGAFGLVDRGRERQRRLQRANFAAVAAANREVQARQALVAARATEAARNTALARAARPLPNTPSQALRRRGRTDFVGPGLNPQRPALQQQQRNVAVLLGQREQATQRVADAERRLAQRTAQARTATAALVNTTRRSTLGFRAAAIASRSLGAAVGFLGGPVGVIVTGLAALVSVIALMPDRITVANAGLERFFKTLRDGQQQLRLGDVREIVGQTRQATTFAGLTQALEDLSTSETFNEARPVPPGGQARRAVLATIDESRELIAGRRREIVELLALAKDDERLAEARERLANLRTRLSASETEQFVPPRRRRQRGPGRTETRPTQEAVEAIREYRTQVAEAVSAGESLPAGFEEQLTPEQLRDRVATLEQTIDQVDLIRRNSRDANTVLDELASRVGFSFETVADVIERARRNLRGFRQEVQDQIADAVILSRFNVQQDTLPQGGTIVSRQRFEAEDELRIRTRTSRRNLEDLERERDALRQLIGELQALEEEAGREDTDLAGGPLPALDEQLQEANKQLTAVEVKVRGARHEFEFLAATDLSSLNFELRQTEEVAERIAAIDLANRLVDIRPEPARAGIEAVRDYRSEIDALQVDLGTQEIQFSGNRRADRFRDTEGLRVNAEVQRRLIQITESRTDAETRLADVQGRIRELGDPAAFTRETQISQYQDLTGEARNLEVQLAQLSAEQGSLEGVDLSGLVTEATTLRLALEEVEPATLALREALVTVTEEGELNFESLRLAIAGVAVGGIQSFGDVIADLATGGAVSFSQFATSIISDLVRILAQVVIVETTLRALQLAFPSFFGSSQLSQQALSAPISPNPAPLIGHEGGEVGSLPTFTESRALRRNERVAVLEVNEEVVTADNWRHRDNIGRWLGGLPRYHEGGIVGAPPGRAGADAAPLRIELVNESGQPLSVEEGQSDLRAGEFVQQIIISDYNRRGPISRLLGAR